MIIQELSQLLKPFLHVDYNTTLGQVKACHSPDGLNQWLFRLGSCCWEKQAGMQSKLQSWLLLRGVGYLGCKRRPSSSADARIEWLPQRASQTVKCLPLQLVFLERSCSMQSHQKGARGYPEHSALSTHACQEWNRKETISKLSPETQASVARSLCGILPGEHSR